MFPKGTDGSKSFIGFNAIENLSAFLDERNPRRILVVRGRGSYASSGLAAALTPLLSRYDVREWRLTSVFPSCEEVDEGVKFALAYAPDLIVAAGGGGVMDTGKLIGFFAGNGLCSKDWFSSRNGFTAPSVPIAAIPSTAGTGSEATHFAVLWRGKEKFSVAHDSMRPVLALVDPQFHRVLPQPVRASSGFDALAQAIESYWSVRSTDESKGFAARAIRSILPCITRGGSDDNALLHMAEGAYWAGKAIDVSQTTAPHAVSYALTGYYAIPHGHAVALTLPSLYEFNSGLSSEDCADPRGAEYVRRTLQELAALLEVQGACQARRLLEDAADSLGLERALGKLGIQNSSDIDLIVEHGFNPERVLNNPRRLTSSQLGKILRMLV
jgi:alcohol dehydrogenase class IV